MSRQPKFRGTNKPRFLGRIFVTFCAVLVPWKVLNGLAEIAENHLTDWFYYAIVSKALKRVARNEKARQTRAKALIQRA
jgi:hypothetical protein